MKKYVLIISFFSLFLFTNVRASGSLFLDAPESFTVGKSVPVTVFLDTEGVSVNSVDISLKISDPALKLSGYQDYNGVIKFWISPPKQVGDTVSFVGGIPGGISSITKGTQTTERIPLVVLLFDSDTPVESTITVNASTILQNDGEGSAFEHTTKGVSVTGIKGFIGAKEGKDTMVKSDTDTIAPSFEQITLIPSSLLSKNPTLIMFNATDEDSGIATYSVLVGGNEMYNVQSPLAVDKRIFSYTVLVEAYDLYGNKQTASVLVPGVIGGQRWLWIVCTLIVFALIIFKIMKRYAKE